MPTKAKDHGVARDVPEQKIWNIPCWLCGMTVEVRLSKKNKPFIICNNCGVQTFVRYRRGEELLAELVKRKEEENGNREISGSATATEQAKADGLSTSKTK